MLAAAVALGPLAVDLYLPALPAIGRALGARPDQVQLTLSTYMLGFSLAQLMVGPLSDRFGRKPVMLFGLLAFALASLACMLAQSIETLLLARFFQALGAAVGPVLGRAAVRDIYGPREAARSLAYIGMVMGLAPGLAPLMGSLLVVHYDWTSTFAVLIGYAGLLAIILSFLLPEPLPYERRQSIAPRTILSNYRLLVRHRHFVGHTLAASAAFAGLFAFLSGSSFVLIEFMEVSEVTYGWLFGVAIAGYIGGNLISARGSGRLGMGRLILLGSLLSTLGGGAMALFAWNGVYSVAAVILPHTLFLMGVGILMPQTMAGAVGPFPAMAGSASALFGFVQMTTAAGVGALVGYLHDGTSWPMAATIGVTGISALAISRRLLRDAGPADAAI